MTAVSTGSAGTDGVVRLRLSRWTLAWRVGAPCIIACLMIPQAWLIAHGESGDAGSWRWPIALPAVHLTLAVMGAVQWYQGLVILTPEAYLGSRPLRRRLSVAVAEVVGLAVEEGRSEARVVAYLQDGGRVVLPFPRCPVAAARGSGRDGRRFWSHFHELGRWWEHHHRAGPQTGPGGGPR
ncbi:MAG: hypothetical protein U0Q15_10055 [Kineosporiaceae bacterium]